MKVRREADFLFAAVHKSVVGPKQTLESALHMSAFGGKADMLFAVDDGTDSIAEAGVLVIEIGHPACLLRRCRTRFVSMNWRNLLVRRLAACVLIWFD